MARIHFRPGRRTKAAIPTVSMADIAFLLIIFFLTTTVFSRERGLVLLLQETSAADVDISRIIQINVHAERGVSIGSAGTPEERFVRAEALRTILTAEGEEDPGLIALVRVDEQASYQDMIDVLDELELADVRRVSIQPWKE